MTLKIGAIIKILREKRKITQHTMAEYLGITEQAISRWENNGGYPDMELIPAIANFLDVSIDELFETDKKAERLNRLCMEASEKSRGYVDKQVNSQAIESYRAIIREFPNAYDAMSSLILHLCHDYPDAQHSEEIIALCNHIISDCPDVSRRRAATRSLAQAYQRMGQREKALQIIEESPILYSLHEGIAWSRECALAYGIAEGEALWENKKAMLGLLHHELCTSIYHFFLCDNLSDLPNDEKIIIGEKIIGLVEIFYEKGDYGWLREGMIYVYRILMDAYLFAGNHPQALDNMEKCAETAICFDTDVNGQYASILVRGIHMAGTFEELQNYENHPEKVRYNQSYRVLHDWFFSKENYAPLRETERFKAVCAKLEKYAKIVQE